MTVIGEGAEKIEREGGLCSTPFGVLGDEIPSLPEPVREDRMDVVSFGFGQRLVEIASDDVGELVFDGFGEAAGDAEAGFEDLGGLS
jgi:hypothetical protein